jgi:serine/threonine protein kinase/Tol biopolymer transport system component
MTLAAGTKLGSYQITGAIGAGGMGEVYLAHDTKLGRDVAIKVLPEAFAHDADRLSRFQREAKMLASLNHSNIAVIHGLEESNGTHYLVMELVSGETLADRIKRDGAVPVEESLAIAKQIAEALEAAHEKGIIHRDLKPANVKVTPEGKVKVLDFGLAKAFAGDTSTEDMGNSPTLSMAATMQGVILGTAAYMSPEQAKGKAVDKRTDIFAFGAVLYELLTGKQAFHGEDVTDILGAVLRMEPDWSQLPEATPTAIRTLLRRCLRKDKRQRLSDATDVRIEIEDAIATPKDLVATQAAPETKGWREQVALAVAGVLMLSLAAVSFIHFRETPPEQRVVRFQVPAPAKSNIALFNLSPDGRWLVFPAGGKLWLRALDSLQTQPLPGTEGASTLLRGSEFWSPDSQYIAFFSQGKLRKIAFAGGPAQTLCDVGIFGGGTWNRDGVILFSDTRLGLFRVPEAGGAAVQVTKGGDAGFNVTPEFLPDGRHFLYTITSGKAEAAGIYVGSLDGQQAGQRLLSDASNASYAPALAPGAASAGRRGYLVFHRGGTLMAQPFDPVRLALTGAVLPVTEGVATRRDIGLFSVSNNGTLAYLSGGSSGAATQLVWKDRTGKSTGTFGPPGAYNDFQLAPDEKRIVFDADPSGSNQDVWVLDSVRGTTSRLTFDPAQDNVPMWSPDGLRIVWPSRRGGSYDLYVKAANGTGNEDLLVKMGTINGWASDWSKDGRYLLYQRPGEKTGQDLWIAPQLPEGAGGDRKPFPYLQSQFDESEGKFSPDGRWVAYVSNESGRNEIYVQSFPLSGAKFQISTGGGAQPKWRKDGTELFYVAEDRMLMAVPVRLGRTPAEPFQPGSPKPLFAVPTYSIALNGRDYAVSNDGQRFLVSGVEESGEAPPVTVVLNWQAGLKK